MNSRSTIEVCELDISIDGSLPDLVPILPASRALISKVNQSYSKNPSHTRLSRNCFPDVGKENNVSCHLQKADLNEQNTDLMIDGDFGNDVAQRRTIYSAQQKDITCGIRVKAAALPIDLSVELKTRILNKHFEPFVNKSPSKKNRLANSTYQKMTCYSKTDLDFNLKPLMSDDFDRPMVPMKLIRNT